MTNTLFAPETVSLAEPTVDTLVNSAYPERKVLAIDGIASPDLAGLRTDNIHDSVLYTLYPGEKELEFVLQNTPTEDETEEYEQRDHGLKRWVTETLQACDFAIPDEGVEVMFDFTYLNSVPETDKPAGLWHTDGTLLTLTVFDENGTEILDETAQDAAPGAVPKPEEGYFKERAITSQDFAAQTGVDPSAHTVKALPNQTVAIGPDAIHRTPVRPAGLMRSGIVCFIGYSG
jgi:hypothetical protein